MFNYGGFGILTPKLRITDLVLSTTENTEVSVIFTDGWQHWPAATVMECVTCRGVY